MMLDQRNPITTAITSIALLTDDEAAPRRFVSKRTACALLDLSESGFRAWLRRGLLPAAAAGSPADEPRWDWPEVVAWMRGDRSSAPRDLLGAAAPAIRGKRRGPAPGRGGRPRKSPTTTATTTTNGDDHHER